MSGDHNMYADQERATRPTVDRFDLEQEIFNAWHVVDDLETVKRYTSDECIKAIDAVKTLADVRFRKLMDTFETLIQERKL